MNTKSILHHQKNCYVYWYKVVSQMKYAVISFRVRTETLGFYNIMRSYGVICKLISTPRSIASSCGLSIKIDVDSISQATNILFRRNYSNFEGIYIIVDENGKEKARKIL